jgi:hypothetical protein
VFTLFAATSFVELAEATHNPLWYCRYIQGHSKGYCKSDHSTPTPPKEPETKGNIVGRYSVSSYKSSRSKTSKLQAVAAGVDFAAIRTGRIVGIALNYTTSTRVGEYSYNMCDYGPKCMNPGTYIVTAQAKDSTFEVNSFIKGCVPGVVVVAGIATNQNIRLQPGTNCPAVRQ